MRTPQMFSHPLPAVERLSLEAGVSGQGALIDTADVLDYQTSGNFQPAQGTIEFWVKPRWAGNDHNGHSETPCTS